MHAVKLPQMALILLLASPLALLADQTSDVEALEAQCEQQREALLKPLRDIEIAKCDSEKHSDPGYCERFWRDYGNASRNANGKMNPRMFDDLPICVSAFEARKALHNRGTKSIAANRPS